MTTPQPSPVGTGKLIFRVATAGGAIPLAGAQVILRTRGEENAPGRGDAIAVMTTDQSGKTPVLSLPTPPKSLSMSPQVAGSPPPFGCFDAEVRLAGYDSVEFVCIPVFDGVTSIQPVNLIPLPENGRPDGVAPHTLRIVESQNPSL